MNKFSRYDKKTLNLMFEQLVFFKKKQLDFSVLIKNLESLLHTMENVDNEWEERFLDEFSTLESINAEMPKMKKDEIDQIINESVYNLIKLIKINLQ